MPTSTVPHDPTRYTRRSWRGNSARDRRFPGTRVVGIRLVAKGGRLYETRRGLESQNAAPGQRPGNPAGRPHRGPMGLALHTDRVVRLRWRASGSPACTACSSSNAGQGRPHRRAQRTAGMQGERGAGHRTASQSGPGSRAARPPEAPTWCCSVCAAATRENRHAADGCVLTSLATARS